MKQFARSPAGMFVADSRRLRWANLTAVCSVVKVAAAQRLKRLWDMPDDRNDCWKAHIVRENSQAGGEWLNKLDSKLDAQISVLKELLLRIRARP